MVLPIGATSTMLTLNTTSFNASKERNGNTTDLSTWLPTVFGDVLNFEGNNSLINSSLFGNGSFHSNTYNHPRSSVRPILTVNEQIICIVLFSSIAFFGILGNGLVIYIYGFVARKRFLKFERLMLLLGIVDLFASLANPLLFIYQTATLYAQWDFGAFGCKLFSSIGSILTSVSLGIILIMAIDRDRAVVTPFKKQYTTITIYKAIAFTVLVTLVVVSPYVYFLKFEQQRNSSICFVNSIFVQQLQYPKFVLTFFLISDIAFLTVLSVTTVRVFVKLSNASVLSYQTSKEFRAKETKRILRIITAMGVTFILLIFPRDILQMIYMYHIINPPMLAINNYLFVNAMLKAMHTSNSCINVILYSIINRRFRREILRLFIKSKYFRKFSGHVSTETTSVSETLNNRTTVRSTANRHESKNTKRKSGKLPAEIIPLNTRATESLKTNTADNFLHD